MDVQYEYLTHRRPSLAVPGLGTLRRRKISLLPSVDPVFDKNPIGSSLFVASDAFDGILILECRWGTLSRRQEDRGGVFWGDIRGYQLTQQSTSCHQIRTLSRILEPNSLLIGIRSQGRVMHLNCEMSTELTRSWSGVVSPHHMCFVLRC